MVTLGFSPNCQTTAMGIMPHRDIERALDVALSLDIPFWPQLPKVSYFEDMYVQALENFPGVRIDPDHQKIYFDLSRFYEELPSYFEKADDPQTFRLTKEFSLVYHQFLERDLSHYPAIRGQMISPISLGLKIVDENQKAIIYHDEVREVLFDFIQKKVNQQYYELREKNPNAFVWVDDPGLALIFSALSGYNEVQAKGDLEPIFRGVGGAERGSSLCQTGLGLPPPIKNGYPFLRFLQLRRGDRPLPIVKRFCGERRNYFLGDCPYLYRTFRTGDHSLSHGTARDFLGRSFPAGGGPSKVTSSIPPGASHLQSAES